jgi:predicted transposase YbfD/YdcC
MPLANDVELSSILATVPDPRRVRSTVHALPDLLFVAVCAAIAGCDTWHEVAAFGKERLAWFRRFVPLKSGVPSHDTFGRVFALLDTGRFAACLLRWTQSLASSEPGRVVAIDGKTLANSFDDATGRGSLHLVSAWAVDSHVVLGQTACLDKSNEIEAIPRLLELFDLNGALVTIDAMGCQTAIAAKILDVGADYVVAVKGNQPTLQRQILDAFEAAADLPAKESGLRKMTTKERRRGGDEEREYQIMPIPASMTAAAAFAGAASIGTVLRRRIEADGSESAELRCFLSNRPPNVKEFANAVRKHWTVENRLHWSLDVTFTEDASRIRKGSAPETTALLRRVALSKLRQDTLATDSLKVRRKRAGWSTDALERILLGIAS